MMASIKDFVPNFSNEAAKQIVASLIDKDVVVTSVTIQNMTRSWETDSPRLTVELVFAGPFAAKRFEAGMKSGYEQD